MTDPILTDLATLPFAEVFRRLSAEQRSGDLQVRSGRIAKTVFFDRGALVFAASNVKKDRLGEALVAVGRISERQFDHATSLMRQRDRRRRFGDALQQAGLMDEKEVGRAIALQVQRIVLSLFSRTEGVASFEERDCTIPPEFMVGLSVHGLLYRGIKSMRSAALIRIGIGDLERKVIMAPVAPFRFSPERATREEQLILDCAQTPVKLQKLVASGGRIIPTRLRVAYALLASGVLSEADRSREDTQPVLHVDDRDFVLMSREPAEINLELTPSLSVPAAPSPRGGGSPAPVAEPGPAAEESESTPPRASGSPATAPEESAVAAAEESIPEPSLKKLAADFEAERSAEERAVIDQLLEQAKVHATIKNHPELIKIFAKLVEMDPGNPKHRMQLGRSMMALPQTRRRAERQFLEAVRLAPNNPDLRFAFGRYYEVMKHRARAREQYRLALAADPRHESARKALEALAPKDSALDNLKKFFR